jgi:hypothetical protein
MKNRSSSRYESLSPNKSPPRGLPDHHFIENRYKSYNRAEDYIKHLNNIYYSNLITSGVHDQAYCNSYKFRFQEPKENASYKVSSFPKSKVNQELLEKQDLINAFNHISFEPRPKTRPRPKSTILPGHRRSSTEKNFFRYKMFKILPDDKCPDCHKGVCQCPKVIKDNFLKIMLKKQKKIIAKIQKGGVFGNSIKKDHDIVIQNSKSPLVNIVHDENTEQYSALKKKSANFIKTSRRKKRETSNSSPLTQSINISPVSLSQKRSFKN